MDILGQTGIIGGAGAGLVVGYLLRCAQDVMKKSSSMPGPTGPTPADPPPEPAAPEMPEGNLAPTVEAVPSTQENRIEEQVEIFEQLIESYLRWYGAITSPPAMVVNKATADDISWFRFIIDDTFHRVRRTSAIFGNSIENADLTRELERLIETTKEVAATPFDDFVATLEQKAGSPGSESAEESYQLFTDKILKAHEQLLPQQKAFKANCLTYLRTLQEHRA